MPLENHASELTLNNMLLSLNRYLQLDLYKHLCKFQTQEEQIEERTDHIESKKIKDKLIDIEDRSHRNNLKFRGIPESVTPTEITPYLQQLLKTP